jgi:hypothetical protein
MFAVWASREVSGWGGLEHAGEGGTLVDSCCGLYCVILKDLGSLVAVLKESRVLQSGKQLQWWWVGFINELTNSQLLLFLLLLQLLCIMLRYIIGYEHNISIAPHCMCTV